MSAEQYFALKEELSCMRKNVGQLMRVIAALMAERRALRSFTAALGMPGQVSRERLWELSRERLRLEGEARAACAAAGFRLKNNDEEA